MIVYGDRSRQVRAADVRAALTRAHALGPGAARRTALTSAFLDLAAIAQAVADAGSERRGHDAPRPADERLMAALTELARAMLRDQDGGPVAALPQLPPLPASVTARVPEGHAFYALYPEAHALAARRLALNGPPRVIGIRSIGTGLSAMVAAALDAPPPITVRPAGHPFARRVRASPELFRRLIAGAPDAHIIVADEGPGLSGSSFGAVADWLEGTGVPRDRIAFLPSHHGDLGAQSSPEHRARWARAQRPVVEADAFVAERIAGWAAELLGPLDGPPADVSGGAWRGLVYGPRERGWPAAMPIWERRKWLVRAGGRCVLLRFAGLGAIGEAKLWRAETLHRAALVPRPLGLVNGWLAEEWIGAERLRATCPDRAALAAIAAYIGRRAALLPDAGDGADLPALLHMARHNAALALGEARAALLDGWRDRLPGLDHVNRPTHVDGCLAPREWLRVVGGGLLKADAHDHAEAHDLIGCQDPAWDVAGAIAEFGLPPERAEELRRRAEAAAGRRIDAGLVRFLLPCFIAFRMGQHRVVADGLDGWPAERARNEAAYGIYAARLDAALSRP